MLVSKVPWNIKTVLVVHGARIIGGLFLLRLLFPLLFTTTPLIAELTDRGLVVILVYYAVHRYRGKLADYGLSLRNLSGSLITGLAAGVVLLGISIFSEKLYLTVFFPTTAEHPLVAQVQNAGSWPEVIVPFLLAGVTAPVAEEFLYRLFTFLPICERWGLWTGAVVSAVIFALLHFNAYRLGEIIVVGTGLAIVYYWSGSLISSIVAHSFINTGKLLMVFFGLSIN